MITIKITLVPWHKERKCEGKSKKIPWSVYPELQELNGML